MGAGNLGTLFVRLAADSTSMTAGFNLATSTAEASCAKIITAVTKMASAVAGAFAVAGVVSLREYAKWDQSFANVEKTVQGSTRELNIMAQALRDMAKELPFNVNELNKTAAAAGQLGIKKENILSFTKVMEEMGISTDLSADNASQAMARFANATGMAQTQFDRLGSTLFALDKATATSASQIMEMAMRIAGAGTTVGMTEAQILSFSASLSSVGVRAERGGTAISDVMERIHTAVNSANSDLAVFARVSGSSAEEFTKSYAGDAKGAIISFIGGLKGMFDAGKNVYPVLEKLRLDGDRMKDVLSRSFQASQLLNGQMALGETAWKKNTDLAEGAAKFYATYNSQMTILIGNLRDIAIQVGSNLAPALIDLSKFFVDELKASGAWGDGLKDFMTNIFTPAVISAVGLIGDSIQSINKQLSLWKTIFLTVADVWVDMISAMAKATELVLSPVLQAMIDQLNLTIKGINLVTGSHIPPLQFDAGSVLDDLESIQEGLDKMTDKALDDFDEIINAKPFSKKLAEDYDAFVEHVNKKPVWFNKPGIEEGPSRAIESVKRQLTQAEIHRNQAEAFIERTEVPGYKYEKDATRLGGEEGKIRKRYTGLGIPGLENRDETMMQDIGIEKERAKIMMADLEKASKSRYDLEEKNQKKLLELHEAYGKRLRQLQLAQSALILGTASKMFGDLASIAETWGGRQSGMYMAMFTASKAFAIAEATVHIMAGIAKAADNIFPYNLAAMAEVVAATASIVNNISAVTLQLSGRNDTSASARAMGGPVSAGSMYMVGEKGPELFSPSQYGSIIPNHALGTTINVHNHTDGHAEVRERNEGGKKVIDVIVRRVKNEIGSEIQDGTGNVTKSLERTFGLRRGK